VVGYPTRLLMVTAMKNTSTNSLTTHELVFIQSRALEGPSPLPKASTKSTGRGQEMLRIGRMDGWD
jgi:hypothetical protein